MIRHIHVDACDSTQDLIKEQTGDRTDVILVSTNKQLKGRGRGTNSWQEIPGTLCFSLTVEPHRVLSFTALEISLLISRFFEYEGCKLGLKWPNDLWDSKQKKCGGVLIQGSGEKLYAGIGLNLFSTHPDFGGVYRETFEFDKESWSLRIAEYIIAHRYTDTDALRNDWEIRCPHMGSQVTISEGTERNEGIFLGLGDSGEARLHTVDGIKSFYNGSLRITAID